MKIECKGRLWQFHLELAIVEFASDLNRDPGVSKLMELDSVPLGVGGTGAKVPEATVAVEHVTEGAVISEAAGPVILVAAGSVVLVAACPAV